MNNPNSNQIIELQVQKEDYKKTRFYSKQFNPKQLGAGQIICKINKFAFTANNITYAILGDAFKYWQFFPTGNNWGIIPVWGFADVIFSNHDDVILGEKLYGYLPFASHVILNAGRLTKTILFDVAGHRSKLNAIYNQYQRCAHDPQYDVKQENLQALFQPLFATAYLLDDFIAGKNKNDDMQIILSSASSKTALGMAILLQKNKTKRVKSYKTIGLTSKRNLEFVKSIACYDIVKTYEEINSIENVPSIYVDFAGNSLLRQQVHNHFDENLKYSCMVGAAHGKSEIIEDKLPGTKPIGFFAPLQARKKLREMGSGFAKSLKDSWDYFIPFMVKNISIHEINNKEKILEVYEDFSFGNINCSDAYILSFG